MIAVLALLLPSAAAFAVPTRTIASSTSTALAAGSRRSFVQEWCCCGGIVAAGLLVATSPALALPMVTTDEFIVILRDSASSIRVVEFSGAQSDTVTVQLVDGTAFGIKDVVESSTDPRSPLKIAAICTANKIPTRFNNVQAALASAPRRTKVYSNARVLEAAEKEKEKRLRIEADEEIRIQELKQMQE